MPADPRLELRQLINELIDRKYTVDSIAKSVGYPRASLTQFIDDPNADITWEVGNDIRELHSVVVHGLSCWGKMVGALIEGQTYDSLSRQIGVPAETLWNYHNEPTRSPRWVNAERIRRAYSEQIGSQRETVEL